tara:strand:- start:185 stop:799 length:615 start_codon:yes stop_codon:yes gene_type:complete
MTSKIISIFLSVCFLFTDNFLDNIPPENYNNWKSLDDGRVSVSYTLYSDISWGRATAIFPVKINKLYEALKDLENYRHIFERITESQVLDEDQNIVYIRLDMPYFLADRDYTVKYVENYSNKDIIIQFYSVIHPDTPNNKGSVTLPRASGEWRLTSIPGKGTKVTYIWNGELLGKFPKSQLHTAWKEQGNEVLMWLYKYIKVNK